MWSVAENPEFGRAPGQAEEKRALLWDELDSGIVRYLLSLRPAESYQRQLPDKKVIPN